MLYLSASPELDQHHTGSGHPERPERARAALQGVEQAGLASGAVWLAPRAATREELERVHSPSYLQSLQDWCEGGGGRLDSDTVASAGSWATALRAAGGVLAVVGALAEAGEGVGFSAHRPPGHHALADQAMGFCLLNNVAVAAAALAEQGQRVMVLDWDVHHGNGTQAIFWDDPRVLYVSLHQWPLYPGTGRAEATGDVYLLAMDELVAPAAEAFAPDWLLISGGFDAHRRDPLAQVALSAGDFADLAGRARGLVSRPGRVVMALEGGYDLEALRLSTGASLAGLLGERFRPERATSGGPGAEAVARAARARAQLNWGATEADT